MYNVKNVKIAKWTKLQDIRFAPKDVLRVDTFLETMLCVSFSIGTFTINHNFSQLKHLPYNMTSYYDCFGTLNCKTSTLDIFARHPKTDVSLLCFGPKLWKFCIFYKRFLVLLCGKISKLTVSLFYNYYKSNLKRLTNP
jgi:hypothetical protein